MPVSIIKNQCYTPAFPISGITALLLNVYQFAPQFWKCVPVLLFTQAGEMYQNAGHVSYFDMPIFFYYDEHC